jgi:hypothetical protein
MRPVRGLAISGNQIRENKLADKVGTKIRRLRIDELILCDDSCFRDAIGFDL